LEPRPLIEPVEHDEVGVASSTSVRGPAVEQPPAPAAPAEPAEQVEPAEPPTAGQPGESVPVAVLQVDAGPPAASQDPPAREEPTS
ncbi:MAG TPA: hypothetical protein VGC06_29510, partial [Actinomycetes bacterium]